MRSLLVASLFLAGPALAQPAHPVKGGEPLWTDSHAKGDGVSTMQAFSKLARALGPAVVNIVAIQNGDERTLLERQLHPDAKPHGQGRGQGTGFIIKKSGLVLTNCHVIEGSDDIRVRLSDDRELTARLVGKDERTDMALLQIDAGAPLPVAPLGNSDNLQIGEWVIAIGNPFGLDHTVTAGIVSAKGRRDVRPGGTSTGFYDFIQTDASINPGNSGGPLINSRGEVVGINTAMNAQAQGIGFAIPINMAKVIMPLLRSYGHAPRAWLGVYPQGLTPSLRMAFKTGAHQGALLSDVVPDSPAAHAGLRPGDLVYEFDGQKIVRADDLTWLVATTPAGRKIPLEVVRDGASLRVDVTLASAPDSDETPAQPKQPATHKSSLGVTVSEITPGIARELGNPQLRGVVVMAVEPESPALESGVERGDLVLRLGQNDVKSLDDYAKAVRAVTPGQLIRVLLRRDGHNTWVAFLKR
ncbi:MAG: trypsin-like peptidase domain-containing protein [Polyangia bacterium]